MSVIIEGEALLNDGVAIVVFRVGIVILQSISPRYVSISGEKYCKHLDLISQLV